MQNLSEMLFDQNISEKEIQDIAKKINQNSIRMDQLTNSLLIFFFG